MLAKVQSCAVIGIEGALVEVEVDVADGLVAFTIVGLLDADVNESRERVRSAIQNSGYLFPFKQITVNLAPADLCEEESNHELPKSLRQPLEEKVVTISRAQRPITYPANCMLIASMSLCPCGFWGDPVKECTCSASAIAHHQKRMNSLLLDQIDIHVEVPRVDDEKLADKRKVETSELIRRRVQAAREQQLQRFVGMKLTCNAEMGPAEVREFCHVEPSAEKLLKAAMQQLHLSARAFHRVLKVARAIADLAGSEMIAATNIAEAVQYRPRVGM